MQAFLYLLFLCVFCLGWPAGTASHFSHFLSSKNPILHSYTRAGAARARRNACAPGFGGWQALR